ncbi:MAG: nuclear transport factor 2 family protein [Acidobacteriota bacterium]
MNLSKSPDSSQTEWQRQIDELQEQSRLAFLLRDVGRLRQLWSDRLVVNSPLNRVLDREQVLDLLQRGVIQHASYDEHMENAVRHGDSVVVMGRDVVTDTPGGPPLQRRFTNVWAASGESWQLIARHANPVAGRS